MVKLSSRPSPGMQHWAAGLNPEFTLLRRENWGLFQQSLKAMSSFVGIHFNAKTCLCLCQTHLDLALLISLGLIAAHLLLPKFELNIDFLESNLMDHFVLISTRWMTLIEPLNLFQQFEHIKFVPHNLPLTSPNQDST